MRTYPLQWEQGKTAAFEVENAYIGLGTIVRLLEKVDHVSHVTNPDSRRRQSGARLEFSYRDSRYAVVEPFGDNSRYWIGPVAEDFTTDITEVMAVFERHQPGLWRRVLGDVVTLRFITGLFRGLMRR